MAAAFLIDFLPGAGDGFIELLPFPSPGFIIGLGSVPPPPDSPPDIGPASGLVIGANSLVARAISSVFSALIQVCAVLTA